MLDEYGLTWPWGSLHVEALAWYDHWLKGHDTGIVDGPPIRAVLPGSDHWFTYENWPPPTDFRELVLRADGALAEAEGDPGSRNYQALSPASTDRGQAPLIRRRSWHGTSAPLDTDLDVIGELKCV